MKRLEFSQQSLFFFKSSAKSWTDGSVRVWHVVPSTQACSKVRGPPPRLSSGESRGFPNVLKLLYLKIHVE